MSKPRSPPFYRLISATVLQPLDNELFRWFNPVLLRGDKIEQSLRSCVKFMELPVITGSLVVLLAEYREQERAMV